MNYFLRPNLCNVEILLLSRLCASLYPSFLDFKSAWIIATSIRHSKLDYCNAVYYSLPSTQLHRLQQNSLACAVVKASKCTHITPKLKSFHSVHWLKVKERNKLLNTTQPSYLYDSIILQLPRFTRSSSVLIDHQPAQHWKAQIAHFEIFDIHHLVSGINYLTHFVTNSNFVLGSFSRKSPNTNTYHAVIIQDSPIFSAQ